MNLSLLFAIAIGLLIWASFCIDGQKMGQVFSFLLIIIVGLALVNWRAGKIRDAYIYFEIV